MKMPDLKKPIRYILAAVFVGVAAFLVFAATKNNSSRRCKGLEINIKEASEQVMVTKADIEKWVTQYGNDPYEGKIIEKVDLAKVEKNILESGYIASCQAYFDLQGYLNLDVEVYRPVARILGNAQPDRFIDSKGNIFPVSPHFSPNVLLISGDFFEARRHLKQKQNEDLVYLLNILDQDEFWKAQIHQLDINRFKEIKMLPLLGNHIIEFGKPEKAESKLRKLMIFYTQILPQKKWSGFSNVSVKYEGQIVCN